MIETPRIAVITEHPEIETKCEDLTKAILVLFYLVYTKELTDTEKINEIMQAIYAEAYGRNYPSETSIDNFFKVKLPADVRILPFITLKFCLQIFEVKNEHLHKNRLFSPILLKSKSSSLITSLLLKLTTPSLK